MRSIEFMAKAQDKTLMQSLTKEERENEKQLINMALGNFTEVLGPDGTAILDLKRKLAGDVAGARKDPHGTLMKAFRLVNQLLRGNETERLEARAAVSAMPEPSDLNPQDDNDNAKLDKLGDQLEEETDDVRYLMDRLNVLDQPGKVHLEEEEEETNVLPLVESLNAHDLLKEKGHALLEKGKNTKVVKGIAYVVILVLVVLAILYTALETLAIIAAWAFLSLFGCGVYTVVKEPKDILDKKKYLTCFAKVMWLPFHLAGKAATALCTLFDGCKNKKPREEQSLLQLQPVMLQLEPTEGLDAVNGTEPMKLTLQSE